MAEIDWERLLNIIKDKAEALFKVLTEPDENGKTLIDRWADILITNAGDLKAALTPESLKMALQYEECSRISLSFEELVKIIKQRYSLKPGIRICVLKGETPSGFTIFDIVSVNEDNEPVFAVTSPWCHLIVASPKEDLISKFTDKSMLVLK